MLILMLMAQLGLGLFALPREGAPGAYRECLHSETAKALTVQAADQVRPEPILSACAKTRAEAVDAAITASSKAASPGPLSPAERRKAAAEFLDALAIGEIEGILQDRLQEEKQAAVKAERARILGDTRVYCTTHPGGWSVQLRPSDSVKRTRGLGDEVTHLTLDGRTVELRLGYAQRPQRPERKGGRMVQRFMSKPFKIAGVRFPGDEREQATLQQFNDDGSVEYRVVDSSNNYHYWYFVLRSSSFRGYESDGWFLRRLKPYDHPDDCMDRSKIEFGTDQPTHSQSLR